MTGTRGKSNKLVLNDFLCGKSTFITVIFFFPGGCPVWTALQLTLL